MTKMDFNTAGKAALPEEKKEWEQDSGDKSQTAEADPEYKGVEWSVIYRIGNIQCALCFVASICMIGSILLGGFDFLRFTSTAWMSYLLLTAYVALRAGRGRNYCHLIAYTGMVTFQTVVYMTSLCWLAYSFYSLDYQYHFYRRYSFTIPKFTDATMFIMVVEVLTLLGTSLTGVFGLVACSRGLGKMLYDIEALIMERRYPSTQITVRPIV